MYTVGTARLILRPFELDDLDELAAIGNDAEVMRYIGDGEPHSKERTAERLDAIIDHWNRHRFGLWAAVEKAGGELMGFCGLQFLDNTSEVEVGYRLARRFWGTGMATEGAKASLRFGFEILNLSRIVAVVHPENLASQRVIEKCGLRYEKDARHYNLNLKYYAIDRDRYEPDGAFYLVKPQRD